MRRRAFIAFILSLSLLFSSCGFLDGLLSAPQVNPGGDVPDINDTPLNEKPTDWESSSAISSASLTATVMRGTPTDISPLLPEDFDTEGALWQSECPGIATVNGGTVVGVKCGRTEISVTAADGTQQTINVTVEFLASQNNGYEFPSTNDNEIYEVSSIFEADRLLDLAIANHKSLLIIDFSAVGGGFSPFEEYEGTLELSSHVSIVKRYYKNAPQVIYFEITYLSGTASEFTETSDENTYGSLANANMLIRYIASSKNRRPDDYEGFKINTENSGTMDVYNSEELWWALQNNKKPAFPLHNSKAELFYERAKMLLRDIITDDMTDFVKALAIFDCLVDGIAYDYDAANAPMTDDFHTDVCYYLEGVFERGRAVCDGKSKAFVLLCRIEGIKAVRDFGDSLGGGAGHAWTYVELDGEWYLVDTTAADAAYEKNDDFGNFFGKEIEITMYDSFLLPFYSLSDKYAYSGIWEELVGAEDYSHFYLYLTDEIEDTGYDFYVEHTAELSGLLDVLLCEDLFDECVLTFAIRKNFNTDLLLSLTESRLSDAEDHAIYTLDYDTFYLCFLLIKGI